MNNVNHPPHYNGGTIEVIDFIEDHGFGFNLGNVIKYVSRAGRKNNTVEDLEKAKWYLKREIKRLKEQGNGKTNTNGMASRSVKTQTKTNLDWTLQTK